MTTRWRAGAILVASSLALSACGGTARAPEPDANQAEVPSEPEPELEPEPEPAPEPEPEPEPEPVELAATLRLDGGEWVLSGTTNLPDGAMLDYAVTHFGSGCLSDNCTESKSWSDAELDLFNRQSRGAMQVLDSDFAQVFEGWGALAGICNTNTQAVDDWTTYIEVSFAVDAAAAEAVDLISSQPVELYELFGYSGERLRVVPPVERIELLDGFGAFFEGECDVP